MINRITKEANGELLEVWEASVRATHDFLSEEDICFYRRLIKDGYLNNLDLYSINNDENKMIGFMGVSRDCIEALFIAPAERRKGIGKSFIDYAINKLHIKKVDVNEQNRQAVGFYKKMGFSVIDHSPLDDQGKPYPMLRMLLK
jgi:putative acetyltransferase